MHGGRLESPAHEATRIPNAIIAAVVVLQLIPLFSSWKLYPAHKGVTTLPR